MFGWGEKNKENPESGLVMNKDYYAILGIQKDANFKQIQHAYSERLQELNQLKSDSLSKGGPLVSENAFLDLKEARDFLSDQVNTGEFEIYEDKK